MEKQNLTINGEDNRIVCSSALRITLWVVGSISLVLGVVGIFLPILPTTPFLLLTASCYLRSSNQFYKWLVSHPHLSRYILAYIDGGGIPLKAKIYTVAMLWLTISFSIYFLPLYFVKVILMVSAILVTVYIWRMPEVDPS